MQKIISVDKPIGWTPLQVIKRFKQINPHFTHVKMSYAGRLDPLARGVLLLLIGEETKHCEKYLALSKEYEFEVVFGLRTDSYDLLGYVEESKKRQFEENISFFIDRFVNNYKGKQSQSYPPYSSRTVKGKPLFWWAKNKKLHEIKIPAKEIEIGKFSCLKTDNISLPELEKRVISAVSSVQGDFRQKEILKRWDQIFKEKDNQNSKLTTAKFKITCSSGTYVRGIVHQMGKEIGTGAIVIDILRTKIGDYGLKTALVL